MTTVPSTSRPYRTSNNVRWSLRALWEQWQDGRDLRWLRRQRQARTTAFEHFVEGVLRAMHQDADTWARAVALCAQQVNRPGINPWHWHAILRRAYHQDRQTVEMSTMDHPQNPRRPNGRSEPMVQRWLWVAVHAQDRWPSAWRFWWGTAREVDDPMPMLSVLVHGRQPEDLDHHGARPHAEELRRIIIAAEQTALRAALHDEGEHAPPTDDRPPTSVQPSRTRARL